MAMSLGVPLMVFLFINFLVTSTVVINYLTTKLLKQGYRYHKLSYVFKFNRRHYELIGKYHVSLRKLLQQGISNLLFYGDLIFNFKKGNPYFSTSFPGEWLTV